MEKGKDKKIKLLVIGDGVIPTGFARVLHSIMKELPEDDYDIHHLALNYTGDPHDFKHSIYPARKAGVPSSPLGFERINELTKFINPDIIFILNDIWVIAEYLKILKSIYRFSNMPKIVLYFPVDGEGYQSKWFNDFDIVTKTNVYTKFGKKQVKSAYPSLDINIIPHGIDKNVFYPLADSRDEFKKDYFSNISTVDPKSFIVLNANRNQPRKMLDIALLGFGMFAKDKPLARYYHHAGLKDSGWDIMPLCEQFSKLLGYDLSARLIVTSTQAYLQSVTDERLNQIYNACDVGINSSTGEGWGLTTMEHAVTRAAQVVPNHTACKEVFGDCSAMVDPVMTLRGYDTLLHRHYLSVEGIAKALQGLYEDKELYDKLSQKAFDKFTAKKYSWKAIAKKWDKLFKEVL